MKRKILFCFLFIFILLNQQKVLAGQDTVVNFESPESTIETYYTFYFDRSIIARCHNPQGYDGKLEKFWDDYKIVDKKASKKLGNLTSSGVLISNGAVEIVVEVTMSKKNKGSTIKTKFWYLLQEIDNEWKIIEHSHIADKNYPAYD